MCAPSNRNKNSRIPKLIHTKTNDACHCRYEHRPEYLVNESSINNFLECGTRGSIKCLSLQFGNGAEDMRIVLRVTRLIQWNSMCGWPTLAYLTKQAIFDINQQP